jgi:hypothetical protein
LATWRSWLLGVNCGRRFAPAAKILRVISRW